MTCSPKTDSVLDPFCDWLDVTYSPVDCPYPDLNRLLLSAGFDVTHSDGSSFAYSPASPGRGSIQVKHSSRWARISASGGACAALRASGYWGDYLSCLSSSPHKVTRLDAAMDIPMDGADLVASMRERHSAGTCTLGRKGIPTSVILATRSDGRETGTWYAGHRTRARTTARVYDKAWEILCRQGVVVPPRARVEVTGRDGTGVTLRTAAEPAGFFWSVASPAILKAPEGVPVFVPNADLGWTAPRREFDPASLLRRRIDGLAELDALLLVADEMGPAGRSYLLHLLKGKVESCSVSSDEAVA